jgi:hypothetical protein
VAITIEEFFVKLGFIIDDEDLKSFQKTLDTSKNAMVALGAVAVATGAAISALTFSVANSLDELGDFAEMEKVSAVALQELGHAAQLNGSSLEAVKSTMSGLNRVMGEAALGVGRGAMTFQKLGFDVRNAEGKVKGLDAMLGEIADRMQGLGRQEQIAMAEKLGIDRSLIPLLLKGSEAISALREEARELGIADDVDVKNAGLFMDSFDRIRQIMKGLGILIASKFMPSMTRLMDSFIAWFKVNKAWIALKLERVIKALTVVLEILGDIALRLIDTVIGLISWISQFEVVTWLVVGALTALVGLGIVGMLTSMVGWIVAATKALIAFNFQALIIPTIIGLIAAAIVLLIDDYVNWKKGNDSVIGDIIAKYPEVAKTIQTIEDAVNDVSRAYDNLITKVSDFIELVINSIKYVKELFSLGFGADGGSMRLPNAAKDAVQGRPAQNPLQPSSSILTQPRLAQPGGTLGATNNSKSVTTTSNQTNTINIRSTDPKAAASEVEKALSKQNRSVSRNNRSAVVQ